MKEKINRKKVEIVSILIIIIIAIIAFFVIRHIKSSIGYVASNMPIIEAKDDGMVKYENNVNGIEIKKREIKKIKNEYYIVIQIENALEEDRFNIPIGIEFVNLDGDVIYNTGQVVDVLLKGMIDEIHAAVTPHIAKLIEKNKIDHVVIKELQ